MAMTDLIHTKLTSNKMMWVEVTMHCFRYRQTCAAAGTKVRDLEILRMDCSHDKNFFSPSKCMLR